VLTINKQKDQEGEKIEIKPYKNMDTYLKLNTVLVYTRVGYVLCGNDYGLKNFRHFIETDGLQQPASSPYAKPDHTTPPPPPHPQLYLERPLYIFSAVSFLQIVSTKTRYPPILLPQAQHVNF
jgi:hypothetical protein